MSETIKIATAVLLARAETSSSCVSATPDGNGYVPPGSCDALFEFYYPSFAAAAGFTAIFALLALGHIVIGTIHKKGFCWVVIMGSLWEFFSFALRAYVTKNQQKKDAYQQSFLLFALAPLWINAFVYMVAGRLIFCFHPEKRVFKFKAMYIGRFFVLADILCFLVQLGGAFMISPGASDKLKQTGLHVYQAGIGLQQAFVFVFLAILIGFHTSMSSLERSGWRDNHNRKWGLMVHTLYFVLTLITLRVAYRLAEYIIPSKGNPLLTHEFYMYVLDAVPMSLALSALLIVHPGLILRGPGSDYREGKKQMKAEAKAAKPGYKPRKPFDPEEESMMGVELHQPAGGNPAWAGSSPSAYSPLNNQQENGIVVGQSELGAQQTMYDPHYGRM